MSAATAIATLDSAKVAQQLIDALLEAGFNDQDVEILERDEAGAGEGSQEEQGETVQEVEEELSVGKRKVASGGVRVTTSVSERPVQKTVTLREEEVEVERRPADRKLKPEEAEAAFQDQ